MSRAPFPPLRRRPLRLVLAALVLATLGGVGALAASTVAASRPVDLGPGVVLREDAGDSAPATDPSPASTAGAPSAGPTAPSAGPASPAPASRTASAPVVPAPPSSYDDDDQEDDDQEDDDGPEDDD